MGLTLRHTKGHLVRVLEVEDASALGAAIIAAVGVGGYADFASGCERAVGLGETVRCDADRAQCYEENYRHYCGLYPSLKGWFHNLGGA